MEPADSWEKLSDALLGPFERDIINGLTGAYRAMEPRIAQAFKRSLEGGSALPLQRLLILRQQLGQELGVMRLPPELAQRVNQALLDGQVSSDFWALAELNKVKQEARNLTPEQAAQAFANASTDPSLLLGPGMAQQNPTALIAAAQRQNALANYAAGGRGTQAFAALNRLVDVDLRGRIIGAVEFHLASGDSWRQLRSTLQSSVELTKSRAQTVARTEMAAAMVEGTKLRYEAEGIQQVQWQAVGSSRTCGYCAPRHGKVYKLGEVVAPAHPNCRCTVTPWDPEWVELGLVDPQAEAESRADVLADLEAAGKKPISGPSPFEKALGMEQAPEALWTPPRLGETAKQARPDPLGPSVSKGPLKRLGTEEFRASLTDYKEKLDQREAGFDPKDPSIEAKRDEIRSEQRRIQYRIDQLDKGKDDSENGLPLGYIYERQGFSRKPILVDSVAELKTMEGLYKQPDGSNVIFYRGVAEEQFADQFKGLGADGDIHYLGKGIYGNGTYAAAPSTANTPDGLQQAKQTAVEYALAAKAPKGVQNKRVTAFGLRGDANIKTFEQDSMKAYYEWEDLVKEEALVRTGIRAIDVGEAAASLGIDAYQVPRGQAEDYWVILNRGAVVAAREADL